MGSPVLAPVLAAAVGGQQVVHHHGSSIADTISSLLSSAGTFFSQLASLSWLSLLLGLALYSLYLLLRSRALFNAVRAAYPGEPVRWRDVWGAYMVGYAVNNVFPLGGGNVAQLFLTRISIPPSSYPTLASALSTGVALRLVHGPADHVLRLHPGRVPQAAGLLQAAGLRHQLLRLDTCASPCSS